MASVIAHYRAMSHQRLVCFQVQQRGEPEPEASEQVNHLTRSSNSSSRDKGSSRLRLVAPASKASSSSNPRSYRRVLRGMAASVRERRVGAVGVAASVGSVPASVVVVAWLAEAVRTTQRRPLVRAPTVPSSSSSFPPRTLCLRRRRQRQQQRRPVGRRTRGVTCSVDNEASRTEGRCRRGSVERW